MIRLHGQIRWSYHISFSRGELKWEAPMIGSKQLFHIIIFLCVLFMHYVYVDGLVVWSVRGGGLVSCEWSNFYCFVLADVSYQKKIYAICFFQSKTKNLEKNQSVEAS
jgi:hypothetical protein